MVWLNIHSHYGKHTITIELIISKSKFIFISKSTLKCIVFQLFRLLKMSKSMNFLKNIQFYHMHSYICELIFV